MNLLYGSIPKNGKVDGIKGNVDINIQFVKKQEK